MCCLQVIEKRPFVNKQRRQTTKTNAVYDVTCIIWTQNLLTTTRTMMEPMQKHLAVQDLSKLKIEELTPLTPEVISRQVRVVAAA